MTGKKESSGTDTGNKTGIIRAEHWTGRERQETGPYLVLRLLPRKD